MADRITIERPKDVWRRLGLGHTSYYEAIEAGLLPPSIPIAKRARGHPAHEVDAVLAARVAGKGEDEIRALVRELLAARSGSNGKRRGRA